MDDEKLFRIKWIIGTVIVMVIVIIYYFSDISLAPNAWQVLGARLTSIGLIYVGYKLGKKIWGKK